jgi:predicted nucleotidyltransferase
MNLEELAKLIKVSETDIWNAYPYGSRVYGTANENSDHDFIVVLGHLRTGTNDIIFGNKVNVVLHDTSTFRNSLEKASPAALECWFLPEKLKLKEYYRPKDYKINKTKVKEYFLAKAANDFKKFSKGSDFYIAKKTLFHSLRVLTFGISIVKNGTISDYSCANKYWEDIYTDPSILLDEYKIKWLPTYLELSDKLKTMEI